MEIFNDADVSYTVNGSGVQNEASANTVTVTLESSQGLNVTKTPNVTSFLAGDIIDYTIVINNSTGQYLTGVRIIDDLGGGNMAYVLGSATLTIGSLTYNVTPISTNPLTFTLQQLNNGQTMTLRYKAQVIFNLPSSVNFITNNIRAIGYTSNGTIVGYANSTIQKKTNGDFDVTKTASENVVFENQVFSYDISLFNNLTDSVEVLEIRDQLPEQFVVTSVEYFRGTDSPITLENTDYVLSGTNFMSVQTIQGSSIIIVPGNRLTIRVSGYFQ